ncbi:MAG: lysozyme inhibitor LprI family protein [Deltaproteobacteria bacterium]|jgi:uncharacterized protein|nr:lysozyme inhibitor LprI family protein [Deltaproteobacteria bacterium]
MRIQLLAASLAAAFCLAVTAGDLLAQGPSFDCNKASSAVELTICNDAELSMLDSRMSSLYNRARRSPYIDGQSLLASQRRWWRERESICGRSRRAVECLIQKYYERIDELSALVD